ncbi:hypothetical protein TcCL_Unassigned06030, partial [Trypanosoma cruzi]
MPFPLPVASAAHLNTPASSCRAFTSCIVLEMSSCGALASARTSRKSTTSSSSSSSFPLAVSSIPSASPSVAFFASIVAVLPTLDLSFSTTDVSTPANWGVSRHAPVADASTNRCISTNSAWFCSRHSPLQGLNDVALRRAVVVGLVRHRTHSPW